MVWNEIAVALFPIGFIVAIFIGGIAYKQQWKIFNFI